MQQNIVQDVARCGSLSLMQLDSHFRGLLLESGKALVPPLFFGGVPNLNQSEARKHCFLASDWLKFGTAPQKFRTLISPNYRSNVS